jgi:hypothetical protein
MSRDVDLWFYFGFRLLQALMMLSLMLASFYRRSDDALIMIGIATIIVGQYNRTWEDSL